MSSPVLVFCYRCLTPFTFLRGALTKCPTCGEEHMSHRDEAKPQLQEVRKEGE